MIDFGPIEDYKAKVKYLKNLGDPHAKTEVFDEKDFARELYQSQGNQYAQHGQYLKKIPKSLKAEEQQLSLFPNKPLDKKNLRTSRKVTLPASRLPKAAFLIQCKDILIKYSSPADREKGRLSPYLSEFMTQIKEASPDKRSNILRDLEKFNLAGLNPHFNRVDEDEIKAQLQVIRMKHLL